MPKEKQWDFFETYFTKVILPDYLSTFLALPWAYIYTLMTELRILAYIHQYCHIQDANVPNKSIKLVYKLHGDALHKVLYKVQKILYLL